MEPRCVPARARVPSRLHAHPNGFGVQDPLKRGRGFRGVRASAGRYPGLILEGGPLLEHPRDADLGPELPRRGSPRG